MEMYWTRRTFLTGAAAAAAAAAAGVACSSERSSAQQEGEPSVANDVRSGAAAGKPFEDFVTRCREALVDLAAGRPDLYKTLWSRADDVVIMGAFGGHERGWHEVMTRLDWASKGIKSTDVVVENVTTVVNDDVGFTVDLERMTRTLNGETYARTLRATHGYRRENGRWHLIFRHADELSEKDEGQGRRGCPKEP
jgi:ketosteroid isomerase-like protein